MAAVVSVTPRFPAVSEPIAAASAMSPKVRAFSTRGRPSGASCNQGSWSTASADLGRGGAVGWVGSAHLST
eukprot:scaffold16013_cov27-Tisochrysis_lutea.AAC.1